MRLSFVKEIFTAGCLLFLIVVHESPPDDDGSFAVVVWRRKKKLRGSLKVVATAIKGERKIENFRPFRGLNGI